MFIKWHPLSAKQHTNESGYKARTVGEGNLGQNKYSSSWPTSTQPVSLHKYETSLNSCLNKASSILQSSWRNNLAVSIRQHRECTKRLCKLSQRGLATSVQGHFCCGTNCINLDQTAVKTAKFWERAVQEVAVRSPVCGGLFPLTHELLWANIHMVMSCRLQQ